MIVRIDVFFQYYLNMYSSRTNPKNPPCACEDCWNGISSDFIHTEPFFGLPIFQIRGCKCPFPPPICHRCRSMKTTVLCKHCYSPGVIETIKKANFGIIQPISRWHKLRQLHVLKSSKLKMMAENWRVFTRYSLFLQSMPGFKDWLQTQGKSGATRVGSELTTLQVLNMKVVTFSRLIIFKLHRNAKNKIEANIEFYLWQKVVAAVIRHIISNFASLHQH